MRGTMRFRLLFKKAKKNKTAVDDSTVYCTWMVNTEQSSEATAKGKKIIYKFRLSI